TSALKPAAPSSFLLEVWAAAGPVAVLALLGALGVFFLQVARWRALPATVVAAPAPLVSVPEAPVRWEFYRGGTFGLGRGFVLRAGAALPEEITAEAIAAGVRAVAWFGAFALYERVPWSDGERVLALAAGALALVLALVGMDGISFPSLM